MEEQVGGGAGPLGRSLAARGPCSGPHATRLAASTINLALLALWAWLHRPSLAHLLGLASQDHLRSSAWALAGALLLVLRQARIGGLRPRLDAALEARPLPLAILLGADLAWLGNARWLDVNLLGGTLMGLSGYGLLGLWMRPRAWRQGAVAALLLVLALPFGHHLQTFAGYPLRLATARLVQAGLTAAGQPAIGVDTILVFENGVSQVDLPCSGVRSLWAGMLFLTAATWIERRRVGPRWSGLALLLGLLLAATNVLRVALLVLLGPVAGWPRAAELAHLPLGVLGFGLACGISLALLRRLPAIAADAWLPAASSAREAGHGSASRRADRARGDRRGAALLLLALLGMIALYSPRPTPAAAASPSAGGTWRFPKKLNARPLPLEAPVLDWLVADGAERVARSRFDLRGLRGSVLIVESRSWRAHHQPERCFEVYGLERTDSRPLLMRPGFSLRFVSLGAGAGGRARSASYWFQSAERSTDDHAARIWDDLRLERRRWVMVSILFDAPIAPDDPALPELYGLLHAMVATELREAEPEQPEARPARPPSPTGPSTGAPPPSQGEFSMIRPRRPGPEAIDGLAAGLFWSWNLVFLAFVLLGFAPNLLPEMLDAVERGEVPPGFLLWGLVFVAIPLAAVAIGARFLARRPRRLFALGYGVEAPLMLLAGLRFFALRQMTPAMALLVGMALAGVLSYAWLLLDPRAGRRQLRLEQLRLVGLTLLLASGLYAAIWLSFYAVPIAAGMLQLAGEVLRELQTGWREALSRLWRELIGLSWRDIRDGQWLVLPMLILGAPLLAYTASLVVGMPLTVSLLYLRAWWRSLRALEARGPRWRPALLAGGTLLALALAFVAATRQPQHRAFALLAAPPQDADDARWLLERSGEIRAGLLNAYLAPQRYLGARGEVWHVAEMYRQAPLELSPQRADRLRRLYECLASPLLYQPVGDYRHRGLPEGQNAAFAEEPALAAERYAAFFDQPIQEAERPAILRAVQSTWDVDRASRASLAVDDREVYLESQSIAVEEHGDWAEVELHEVYRNQTFERQEVVYWFNLPESAVITGLWLGESGDRAGRHAFRVAPRGAAQQLYREEVRRRVDPALIEQIGPRQYRLRVFPILPRRVRWDGGTRQSREQPAPPLHLWLRYAVMAERATDGRAHWPMPRLAELRNLYWDRTTRHVQEGVEVFRDEAAPWLPEALPARGEARPGSHRVDLPGGWSVLARPAEPADRPALDPRLRLDLILDGSRSMAPHAEAAAGALADLRRRLPDARIDLYLTASDYSGQPPRRLALEDFDPRSALYFGGQNAAELLLQHAALAEGPAPDAILVLTDGSGYELGASSLAPPVPEAPVWMLHLDGQLPLGYDDGTLEAIQASGGGVAGSVDEALDRLGLALQAGAEPGPTGIARDRVDGYLWSVLPTEALADHVDRLPEAVEAIAEGEGFEALAARRWILAERQAARGRADRLASLDALHAVARRTGIVTPYSSMIVLVEPRQERRLEALSQAPDRFERELEALGETEEAPLAVTGVPEPEEWLLLALAAALLLWRGRGRRTRPAPLRPAA